MINVSKIELGVDLWTGLKTLGRNGKKGREGGREKTSLWPSVNARVVIEGKVHRQR